MKCPACGKYLRIKKVDNLIVDICKGGCGGIWLDRTEYKKVDEQKESAGEELLNIEIDPDVKVNTNLKRMCPRCETIVMNRRFSSVKHEVEIDKCLYCGGYWLDGGELGRIRNLFDSTKDKTEATNKYLDKLVSENEEQKKQKKKDESTIFRFFKLFSPFT